MKRVALILLLLTSSISFGQAWSGILNAVGSGGCSTLAPTPAAGAAPACAIDWSTAGVGGIPVRSTICSTIAASTCSNGASDCTTTIQNALNSCTSGQTVSLGTGTFRVNSHLSIPSNITLRGNGPNNTTIDCHGTSSDGGCILLGTTSLPSSSNVTNITSGATAGSTSIVVSSATGISIGTYLVVSETNASGYVTIVGGEGSCTWCDDSLFSGNRVRRQIVEVTSVTGTTIGITPALYTAYSNTPQVMYFTAAAKNAGVESLQTFANNSGYSGTGYTAMIYMGECAYCWVKKVEANYADGDWVHIHYGFRNEVRDSYFSNSYVHGAGQNDSDVFVASATSNSLIENNIIERGHVGIMLNWGSAGNVISYNYTEGELDANSTNFVIGGIGLHGAHPQFNLMEGNVADQLYPDQVWGSSSHNTSFRNWWEGTTKSCNPTTGRGTVSCTGANGWFPFQASRAAQIAHLSWYYNFVGDVVGSDNQKNLLSSGNPTSHTAILTYSSTRSYDSTNYNFTFGYGESGDDGSGTGCSVGTGCHSTDAYNTAFLYKEYTYANTTSNCLVGSNSGTCTTSLPNSFYLSAKPIWWNANVAYPAIGPDVTGGTGPGGHTSLTKASPAQNCYLNVMGGSEGGAGSPISFDPNACYYPLLTVTKAGGGTGTVTSDINGTDGNAINCGSTCSNNFGASQTVTLTASATGGGTFAGWSGGSCAGTGTCVTTMSSAVSVTATFNGNTAPTINSFTATFFSINPGNSSTLSWNVTSGTTCSIDQGIGSVNASSGTQSVSPSSATTYTLSCTNVNGTSTAQVTIGVTGRPVSVPLIPR